MQRLVFLFLFSYSFAQWSSFSVSGMRSGNNKTQKLYQYGGMIATHQTSVEIPKDRRIAFGASFNKGLSNKGFTPLIHSKIKVSWNLSLRGRLIGYSAEEGTVQLYGWGLSLIPGKEDDRSNWVISFDSGRLNSHNQIKLTSYQFMGKRSLKWEKMTFQIGLGMNFTHVDQLGIMISEKPTRSKLQSNFVNIGTTLMISGLKVIPQLRINSDYNLISISIVDTF